MTMPVPPTRNPGDSGHIEDHNEISSDLTTLSTSLNALSARLPSGTISVGDTQPTSPAVNDVWFDTTTTQNAVVYSTTGQPHYIGPDFPPATSGITWFQTCPGNAVTPTLQDGFESGDTSHWDNVTSVTVGRSYARTGLYGALMNPSASVSAMSWATTRVPQGHAWASFEHWFRIDELPPVGQSAAILTIQNNAQQDNFDLYVNNSGYLAVDLYNTDFLYLDTAPVIGQWYSIEGRLFYGAATYTVDLRLNGRVFPTLSSNGRPGTTTVRSYNLGTSSAQSYKILHDYAALWVGDADAGYLNAQRPVMRQCVAGVWL